MRNYGGFATIKYQRLSNTKTIISRDPALGSAPLRTLRKAPDQGVPTHPYTCCHVIIWTWNFAHNLPSPSHLYHHLASLPCCFYLISVLFHLTCHLLPSLRYTPSYFRSFPAGMFPFFPSRYCVLTLYFIHISHFLAILLFKPSW